MKLAGPVVVGVNVTDPSALSTTVPFVAFPTLPIESFRPLGAAMSLPRSSTAGIVSGSPATAAIGPSFLGWIVCSTLIMTFPLAVLLAPSVTV